MPLFRFSEQDTPVEYFGEQLKAAGYNHVGHEPMYSGITGQEFAADIYLGVVYYQRLRHMVNDKYQVRTTGPVHALTRQPVKVSYEEWNERTGCLRFPETPKSFETLTNFFSNSLSVSFHLFLRDVKELGEFVLEKWNVTLYSLMELLSFFKIVL